MKLPDLIARLRRRRREHHGGVSGGERDNDASRREPSSADDVPESAADVLARIRGSLLPRWLDQAALDAEVYWRMRAERQAWRPRVMIGTLHAGEQELEAAKASVARQTYDDLDHVVISGLPKQKAHAELYRRFLASDAEILVKLDADMVLLDEGFLTRVVDAFRWDPQLAMLQMAISDHFTGREMQGINAYSKAFGWDPEGQDPLFTDRTSTRKEQRRVVWATFHDAVVHAPDPNDVQAFRFGVHRALKVRKAASEHADLPRAREQLMYLERTCEHARSTRARDLLLASIAAELTLLGQFDVADLDHPSATLAEAVRTLEGQEAAGLERRLQKLRSQRATDAAIEALRAQRDGIADPGRADRILLLVASLDPAPEVVRALELARALREEGVQAVVAAARTDPPLGAHRTVSTIGQLTDEVAMPLEAVLDAHWDVALCSDASSGLICLLPWVGATVSAVELLRGWRHRSLYALQIDLVRPDLVLAASSEVAEHYPEYCPTVVAGGFDPTRFHARGRADPAEAAPLSVCIATHRPADAVPVQAALEACRRAATADSALELHVAAAAGPERRMDRSVTLHLGADPAQLATLFRSVDVVVCPDDDLGWNDHAAQAMACGATVVCTPAGSSEFAIDGRTAIVVEPGQPSAATKALVRLAHDPELRRHLRTEGLAAVAGFGWPEVARRLLDVLAVSRFQPEVRELADRRSRARIAEMIARETRQ